MVNLERSNKSYATTQNFLELLKANITSVDTPNPAGGTVTHTVTKWATAYNDTQLSVKTNYPILIVKKASVPDEFLTFRQKQTDGSIEVQIHCTNSISTSKFMDSINDVIEDNESELKAMGITKIWADTDDDGTFTRNGFKDHWAMIVFKFEFEFNYGD